jgi:glycosyltransferase involved in cell wall biosynthesis
MYNEERFVAEAIDSVLAQTLRELEVIVVDDGSSDASVAIASRIAAGDPRVRVLTFPNAGGGVACNRGLARAAADYVCFLEADDLMRPTRLERQLAALESRPDLVAIGCLVAYVNHEGRRLGVSAQCGPRPDNRRIARGELMPFTFSSMLARTQAVRDADGLPEFLPRFYDLYLVARLASFGGMECLEETLGDRRIHGQSLTSSYGTEMFAATDYVQKALADPGLPDRVSWDEFRSAYHPPLRERRIQRAYLHYREGAGAALDRRWPVAAKNIGLALLLDPGLTLKRAWIQLRGRPIGTT